MDNYMYKQCHTTSFAQVEYYWTLSDGDKSLISNILGPNIATFYLLVYYKTFACKSNLGT